MSASRQARFGALSAIVLALLPAALALWIHDARTTAIAGPAEAGAPAAATLAPAPAKNRSDLTPDDIARDVERIRGLKFAEVPPVVFIDQAQAQKMQDRQAAKVKRRLNGKSDQLEKLRRQSAAALEFTKLAGVVDPDFNVQATVKSLLGSVIGEFDPDSRKVKVLETFGETPEQRATVVSHELDHSLDNAHYPRAFKAKESTNSERQLAVSALVEGTATVVAQRFDEQHGYQAAVAGGDLLSAENAGYGVPPVLAAQFRFPYTSGAKFVQSLYDRADGWRLVNRAFRHPPTSTAQILDPELWIRHTGYAKVRVNPRLGAPLELADQSISGQLDAELVLALVLPANVAVDASEGWDGGSIAVWKRPEGGKCAPPCRADNAGVIADRWRSVKAAARFLGRLPAYLRARVSAQPDGVGLWRIDDGFAAIALNGHGTAMAFAPSGRLARHIATGAAANAEAAR